MTAATTKLHIGCGAKFLKGFIHVDVLKYPHVDVVCDLRQLHEHFAENTIHEIYACHVLEHLGRHEVADVLAKLCALLAPGGTIRIAVPDIEQVMRVYSAGILPLSALYGFLWGGQRDEFDVHKIGFDMSSLSTLLYENGFGRVQRYHWQEFLPPSYDDYSKSYIPHMDFEHGQLMSLNVIAQKKKDAYIFCTGGFTNAINSIVGILHFAKRMRYRVHILWLEGYIANDICLEDVFDLCTEHQKDLQIEFHNEREFIRRVQHASAVTVACTHNINIPCLKGFRGHIVDPRIIQTSQQLASITESYQALFFHTDMLPPFARQQDFLTSFFDTFKFKESLSQEARSFIIKHDARVALHIRGTDLLSTTSYTLNDIESFARSVASNHTHELPIIICSDDEHVERRLAQFPELFVSRAKKYVTKADDATSWFEDAGTDHIHCGHMVHQGRIYKQYSSFNVVRTKEQILGGIIDLLILAMVNNIYCFHTSATSTYYSFAKLLNQSGLFKFC